MLRPLLLLWLFTIMVVLSVVVEPIVIVVPNTIPSAVQLPAWKECVVGPRRCGLDGWSLDGVLILVAGPILAQYESSAQRC